MAILNIVKDGDEILRKKSKPIEKIDEKLLTFIQDMKDTMEKAGGVGLAAVQVGKLRRVLYAAAAVYTRCEAAGQCRGLR